MSGADACSPCWVTQQRDRELRLVGVGVIHAARGAFKPVRARHKRERGESVIIRTTDKMTEH